MSALSAVLAQLRAPSPWLKWLAILLILVPLAILLVKAVRARRKEKPQPTAAPAPPRLRLRRVWNEFLGRTPAAQRRGLALFQPFIVLGDAGAGKSALIDRHIDWRGHLAQFHPSHVDDPLLQIYRGTQAVVQELSATLLDDTSPRARKALERLWRPLRRGRTPRVVIALSATRLMKAAPDQLVRQAQMVRGKLDLLAELLGRSVETTVVVTHSDQLSGFVELATLLRERGQALKIEPPAGAALDAERGFGAFEPYLPLVLADAGAPSYLRALGFFDELTAWVRPLDTFLRTLRSVDAIGPEPTVSALYLTSSKETGEPVWSPFASTLTAADVRRFRPLRKHTLAAAGLAAAGSLYLIAGYQAAHTRIDESSRRLDLFLEAPSDDDARADWIAGLAAQQRSTARHLLPGFFAGDERFGEEELHRRFVLGVRERLLLPLLSPAERNQDGTLRLYALSLLYASNRGELGKFVLQHASQWAEALRLPPSLVRAYIEAADPSLPRSHDGRDLAQHVAVSLTLDTPDLTRFVGELGRRLQQPFMSAAELQQLKGMAAPVRRDAQALARRDVLAVAAGLLKTEAGIDLGEPWRLPRADGSETDAAAVEELLGLVERAQLDGPDNQRVDLAGLLAQLTQLAAAPPVAGKSIAFTLHGQPVNVDAVAWDRLIVRSRVALAVREFIARDGDALATLFAAPAAYPPFMPGGRGDGCTFEGGARVDGVFTAQAFGDRLGPALAKLPELLAKLPLPDEEKQQLTEHVVDAVGEYAERYAEQYRNLFAALRCRARSAPELRYSIGQLLSSSSPLRAVLREVGRNTALTLPRENPFTAPLESVPEEFAALRALAPVAGGAAPALDGWVLPLRAIQAALDGRTPPGADKEPEGGLRARLSPLGRLALSIYRGDEDSLKVQVDRWLAAANLDTEWWPQFSAPIDDTYALGRRELQKTLAEAWGELEQAHAQPLFDVFPFKRDAEAAASSSLLEAALAPKQAFWSGFDAALAPVLLPVRDGWRARDGRGASLLPADLLPVVNRMTALSALLFDKEGKPKPLQVRVRPLLLPPQRGESPGAPSVLASYLQVAGTTLYGFNQHAEWSTLKIEWWKPDSAAVGVAVENAEGRRTYRAVTVMDAPWSFWRLLQRAGSTSAHMYEWQVPSPLDGRTVTVQFEIKDDLWPRFASR